MARKNQKNIKKVEEAEESSGKPADSIPAKPFINSDLMETMVRFRYAPQDLLRPVVLRQAYWASVVIGLGQPPTLPKD